VCVQSQTELLEIIRASRPSGGFARTLHRREQQPDQDRDDGDHDQEFDQRETTR
jgi:hypothetical protein